MENRSSNKILIVIIAFLLLANIATITLFLLNKKADTGYGKDDRKNSMRNYLKNEIKFSDKQLATFDSIKNQQHSQTKLIFDSMRTSRQDRLKFLGKNDFADSFIKDAANAAARQQSQVEVRFLEHLKEIRQLCTPEQMKRFDTGFYKIMNRQQGDDKKKEK
jgi:periplasmic protein CpxP/Spy